MSTQQHTDCRECRAGLAQALTLDMGWHCMTHGPQRFSDWIAPNTEASQIVRDSEYVQALVDAARPFAEQAVGDNSLCHRGICSAAECGRCGRILRLREALRPFIPAAPAATVGRADAPCLDCGQPLNDGRACMGSLTRGEHRGEWQDIAAMLAEGTAANG